MKKFLIILAIISTLFGISYLLHEWCVPEILKNDMTKSIILLWIILSILFYMIFKIYHTIKINEELKKIINEKEN
jgi:uncharacterized membrane protein